VLHKGTTMKPDQMLSLLEWLLNSYLAINFIWPKWTWTKGR